MPDGLTDFKESKAPQFVEDALASLWRSIYETAKELKDVRQVWSETEKANAALKEELDQKESLITRLNEMTDLLQSDNSEYVENIEKMNIAIKELEKRNHSLNEELIKIAKDYEGAKRENDESSSEVIKTLNAEIEFLSAQNSSLRSIQIKNNEAEAEVEKQKEENLKLNFELIQKDELIIELRGQLNTLSDSFKKIEREPQLFKFDEDKTRLLEDDILYLRNELSKKNELIESISVELSELKDKYAIIKEENENVIIKLNDTQNSADDKFDKNALADEIDLYLKKLEKYLQ